MSTYQQAAAAYRAGYAAARSRAPRRNPHDGLSAVALERVLAIMWARGFSRGNRVP